MIGRGLVARLLARQHAVTGTSRCPTADGAVYLDLSDGNLSLASLPRVDAVVICAAMAKFSECRDQPDLARRVNVEAPARIARHFSGQGMQILLLSTSAVFDCDVPYAGADAIRRPRSIYGKMKAEAEDAVLAVSGGAVLRLTKVVGRNWPLINDWIARLRSGETIQAFADHSFCPIELPAVLDAIVAILESGESGIFQVSGGEDMTYVAAAGYLAERLGVPAGHVIGISAAAAGMPVEDITRYTSLETSRLTRLTGYRGAPAREVMAHVFDPLLPEAAGARH